MPGELLLDTGALVTLLARHHLSFVSARPRPEEPGSLRRTSCHRSRNHWPHRRCHLRGRNYNILTAESKTGSCNTLPTRVVFWAEVRVASSTVTRKGQVTIPKEIRERLGVREGQRVIFVIRGGDVILKVLQGNILDLKGSVKARRLPEDFECIRRPVKKAVGQRLGSNE